VVGLEFLHGSFGGRVPLAGGGSGEVVLADESALDFFGAFGLDLALAWGEMMFLRPLMVQGATGGGSAMSPRSERGSGGQKCA
jgi:hypothetical protein